LTIRHTCACPQCAARACLVPYTARTVPKWQLPCPRATAGGPPPTRGFPSGKRVRPGGRTIDRPAVRIVLTSPATPRISPLLCAKDSFCPRSPFVAQSGPRCFLDSYPEFRRPGGMTPPITQGRPSRITPGSIANLCGGGGYDNAKGPVRFGRSAAVGPSQGQNPPRRDINNVQNPCRLR